MCFFSCRINNFDPCPLLVGIKKNSYESVKLFLDFLIENNDYVNLDYVLEQFNNHGFRTACKNNYVEIAKYLCKIKSNYRIEIKNNIIMNYYIDDNYYNNDNDNNKKPELKKLKKLKKLSQN